MRATSSVLRPRQCRAPAGHRDGPARCAGAGPCPRCRRGPGPVWLGWPFWAGRGPPGRGGTGKSRCAMPATLEAPPRWGAWAWADAEDATGRGSSRRAGAWRRRARLPIARRAGAPVAAPPRRRPARRDSRPARGMRPCGLRWRRQPAPPGARCGGAGHRHECGAERGREARGRRGRRRRPRTAAPGCAAPARRHEACRLLLTPRRPRRADHRARSGGCAPLPPPPGGPHGGKWRSVPGR